MPRGSRPGTSIYYDSNPLDGTYSENAWGRLAAVEFQGTASAFPFTYPYTFNYQYSYNAAGRVTKQRMIYPQGPLDLTVAYSWDNEGRMTSLGYPSQGYPLGGPVYNYQFDNMGRVGSMTTTPMVCCDVNGNEYPGAPQTVASATYGVAGETLSLTYPANGYISETRTYNSMFQLTRMTSG